MTAIGFSDAVSSRKCAGEIEKRALAWYNRDRQKPKCEKSRPKHSFLLGNDARKIRNNGKNLFFSIFLHPMQ